MTRKTGQITTLQAALGALTTLAVAAGIIVALGQLIQHGDQIPILEAPAQEQSGDVCSRRPDTARRTPAVAAADLIECPATFDGVTVRYEGEVVRAVLLRGTTAWVHLNDDRYALDLGPLHEHRTAVGGNSGMPVSIPATIADDITHVGDARHRGDILAVTGTFHRADPHDGGGPTIRAETVQITRRGRVANRRANHAFALTAAAVLVATLAVALIARMRSLPGRAADESL